MDLGSAEAGGECLLFLHADTQFAGKRLSNDSSSRRRRFPLGGRFDFARDNPQPVFKLIALITLFTVSY